jgi:hypothetical protein
MKTNFSATFSKKHSLMLRLRALGEGDGEQKEVHLSSKCRLKGKWKKGGG